MRWLHSDFVGSDYALNMRLNNSDNLKENLHNKRQLIAMVTMPVMYTTINNKISTVNWTNN